MPEFNLGKVRGADGVTPNIQINSVETVAAGQDAYFKRVENSPDSDPLFDVGIPRGGSGVTPDIQVGTTETAEYGANAEVTRRAGSPDVQPIFDFKLPRGARGPQGNAPAQSVLISESLVLTAEHANKLLIVNSENDVTIVVPTAATVAMEADAEIEIYRAGSGAVTLSPQSGVTFLCKEEEYSITDQFASAAIKLLTAYDSTNNTWAIQGAIG